jgi:AcrR family transcriptional regulator
MASEGSGSKKNAVQSRETWLTAALEQLRAEGPGGLAVDKIARRLGITRGSFYHHFENLEDLVEQLPTHWMHRYAPTPFEVMIKWEPTVEKWVHRLVCDYIPDMGRMRYDAAMRAWAETDKAAERALFEVDTARWESLVKFFKHGGCGDCAEHSATLAYSMILGLDGVGQWGADERALVADQIIEILRTCRPSP